MMERPKRYVIELSTGTWLADRPGAPGTTGLRDNAIGYPTREDAEEALEDVRRYAPFERALIYEAARNVPAAPKPYQELTNARIR